MENVWDSTRSVGFSMDNGTVSENLEPRGTIAPALLQYVFGILGNVLAFIMLAKTSDTHKWRPFYRLVCGLVITDFSLIFFVFPAILARYGSGFTFVYPKELCYFISFIFSYCFLASGLIISAMSIERYFAVVYPVHYTSSNREKETCFVLFFIWSISGMICGLHVVGVGSVRSFYPGTWCFFDFLSTRMVDKVFSISYSVLGLIMLMITLACNIMVITYLIHKCLRGITYSGTDRYRSRRASNDALAYTICLLFVIVVSLTICWTPFMIQILLNAAWEHRNQSRDLLAVRLTVTNAIVDPWVYILVRKDIFQTLAGRLRIARQTSNTVSTEVTREEISVSTSNTMRTSSQCYVTKL